jgi:hypothetical protein
MVHGEARHRAGMQSEFIETAGEGRRRAYVLKVSRAVLAKVPHFGALRLLVLEGGLAGGADALRLGEPSPTRHFDIADSSIGAEMPGDREIIDNANGD